MKNIKNKLQIFTFSFLILPGLVWGADEFNPLKVDSMEELIGSILEGLTFILTPLIVLAFIYSGFLFVSAQGQQEKIQKAKTAITYTIVGAALILGANLIFTVVTSTISDVIGPIT